MVANLIQFLNKGEWPLFFVGLFLIILAVWLIFEAIIAVRKFYQKKVIISSMAVFPPDSLNSSEE
jgi:hypothetical protein